MSVQFRAPSIFFLHVCFHCISLGEPVRLSVAMIQVCPWISKPSRQHRNPSFFKLQDLLFHPILSKNARFFSGIHLPFGVLIIFDVWTLRCRQSIVTLWMCMWILIFGFWMFSRGSWSLNTLYLGFGVWSWVRSLVYGANWALSWVGRARKLQIPGTCSPIDSHTCVVKTHAEIAQFF